MDKVFIRNFLLFVVLLTTCVGFLIYYFISSDKKLGKIDDKVVHTYQVISEAEKLATRVKGMLAAQRGYLLTGDKEFRDEYDDKKAEVSEHIAALTDLTQDNASQQSRLEELRAYYINFSDKLEERASEKPPTASSQTLEDVSEVNRLKDDIIRINAAVLEEEYNLLNGRISALEVQKSKYLYTLIVGVIVGSVLLLMLNSFLLRAQRRRTRVEASLKESEDRFSLAMEGVQDGLYDWDIATDKVFYSRSYFEMLGYKDKPQKGTREDSLELIHPEDKDALESLLDDYLNDRLSEFSHEFRMKHASGRWVWIQSKGKALFKNGKAYRMVGVHTDITHMKKAQEKLEAEKNQAEEANMAKSEFLAHMSHEIRTPLTAISGIAEILEKNQTELDDRQKKLVRTLGSSTESLKDLISDILDFSKIESGELELTEEDFDLNHLFEQVVSMMSLKASEKGVSFVLDYKNLKNVEFCGDSVRIRQILVNLISNAIKFTDAGGSVSVQAYFEDREETEYLRVDVTDTGIGIAPENFDLVFERFKQADSSVSRKYGGTGLGLPISRNLSRLMGGDIFISSEVGKGSTFSLLIPSKISAVKGQDIEAVTQDNKKLTEKIQASLHDKVKVLIVEDYEGNVVVVSYILDEIGLEYDVASTGLEAVHLWQNHHYDLILMDVQMPEMDGFTATKTIREMESEKGLDEVPIIGMTAHALVGDKNKCIEAGMNSYLPKPLVERDFKKEILKYLRQSKKKAA
ncbi:MAG TPA: ATP-binding protein [Emcibacteraceae bacterium]|nr:ATP-binding protein [Emcibacteraceae bacterium]